jgi:hypothetical protein
MNHAAVKPSKSQNWIIRIFRQNSNASDKSVNSQLYWIVSKTNYQDTLNSELRGFFILKKYNISNIRRASIRMMTQF